MSAPPRPNVTASRDTPIVVSGLSKRFRLYTSPWLRALDWVAPGKTSRGLEVWALRDVSFEVARGKCLGVIGNNGAGKSTLLKTLTGTLHPTSGELFVSGRLFSILELSSGFLPDLTGRQNVFHASRLLALPPDYVGSKLAEIEAFAELGEFFDRPFKTYSSGMQVRLAFSLYAFLEPDVLLLDEALSVGDVFFQQKSYGRVRELLAGGITSVFVSHDMAAIRNLCDETILLDHGQVVFRGSPEEAVSRYYGAIGKKPVRRAPAQSHRTGEKAVDPGEAEPLDVEAIRGGGLTPALEAGGHGVGGLRIVGGRVVDAGGHETLMVPLGGTLRFQLLIEAREDVPEPAAGIHVYDRLGNLVFAAGTRQVGASLPPLERGQELAVELAVTFDLGPGPYTFSLGCGEPADDPDPNVGVRHHICEKLGPVLVGWEAGRAVPSFYGIARLAFDARCGEPRKAADACDAGATQSR